jgi:chromosomal replication initiation ATPase DnaA
LFSARAAPARWQIALADLRSRLNALPAVPIAPPDDPVLGAVLLKLFADRQLQVGVDVIQFAVTRMERSFEAAERLVAAVDVAALASQRRVSIPLLREILPRLAGADQADESS